MGSGASAVNGHSQFSTQSAEYFTPKTTEKQEDSMSTEQVRRIDDESRKFDKHLEDIFGSPATSEPNIDTKSDDSKLDLVVLLSAEDVRSNNKGLSSSIPSFDDPMLEQLNGLANDIDEALTGHDDVMKDIRGLSSISTVSSAGTTYGPVEGLRMKGSTIEPLPGVIPIRVNWVDPEKIMRQERLLHKTFEAKMKSLHDIKLKVDQDPEVKKDGEMPTVSGDQTRDPQAADSFESRPKTIITRFDYTEEEIELMRNIEKEYGGRQTT